MVSVFSLLKLDKQEVLITGDNQLKKRKIKNLLESLTRLGLEYEFNTDLEIPFKIKKSIGAGETRVSGKSSQFLSSLLLTLPFLEKTSTIYIDEINEKPYIDMTLEHLNKIGVSIDNFNYKKIVVHPFKFMTEYEFSVPSDFSSATYIILATILSKGDVDIYNLDTNDTQGDKAILEIVKSLGCNYSFNKGILNLSGTIIRGGSFDMNSTPDMLPALVFFLLQFPYYFEFINIEPIRYKETDRVQVLYDNLVDIGIEVKMTKNKLSFYGKDNLSDLKINGANDHRIIMGATLLGMKIDSSVEIFNIKNINSSYPDYISDIEKIGVNTSCSSWNIIF